MRVIQVTIEYSFGDIVYLKTDLNFLPRIVVEWSLNPGTLVKYGLKISDEPVSYHVGLEITDNLVEIESYHKNLLD